MKKAMVLGGCAFLLSGCVSLLQHRDEVYFKEPEESKFNSKTDAAVRGREDLIFAWLSDAAYGNTKSGKKSKDATPSDCPISQDALRANGWKPWPGFPDEKMRKRLESSSLRVEIWIRDGVWPAVAVSFGGTDFTNLDHLKANFRWINQNEDDAYFEIQHYLAPAFIREYKKAIALPEWSFLENAPIYTTGHSLGGGLAQQFAYSLPEDDKVPRVTKAVVFNTSPVTAYETLAARLRSANAENLEIDRIYERGEILSPIRAAASSIYAITAKSPRIKTIRYSLFSVFNPIEAHKIGPFACELNKVVRMQAPHPVDSHISRLYPDPLPPN